MQWGGGNFVWDIPEACCNVYISHELPGDQAVFGDVKDPLPILLTRTLFLRQGCLARTVKGNSSP